MICVQQCVCVGVGLCTRHNPNHTDYMKKSKQRNDDSQISGMAGKGKNIQKCFIFIQIKKFALGTLKHTVSKYELKRELSIVMDLKRIYNICMLREFILFYSHISCFQFKQDVSIVLIFLFHDRNCCCRVCQLALS